MTTNDLIRDLCSWIRTRSQPKNEGELHAELLRKLDAMHLPYESKSKLPNPRAGGVSQPDVLVTSVDPQLLIEIKASGEWRHASQAAWQLFQAAELLQERSTATRKLAIFGGKITDPIMWKMLKVLDIEAVETAG